jgi:pimeloyl-ACP methyl ester carboxylesterase
MREVALPQGKVRVRETGQGAGRPTLVLATDPPNVLEQYGPLLVALRPHARVVAFEPLGFGHSSPGPVDPESQAEAVIALLDKLGLAGCALALPCAGAYVALRVAARRPDLVSRLVALQAPAWEDELAWIGRVDRRRALRTPGLGPAIGWLRAPQIARAWYRAALPTPEAGDAFGALAVEAFDHGARFPLADALRALERAAPPPPTDLPTLAVWGARDRTHRGSDPAGFRRHAPRAEVVVLDDAGHFPELEQPRRFAEEYASWARRTG